MTWLLRAIGFSLGADHTADATIASTSRCPEPPVGFVKRSDPSYYFLVRQHWN